jgi:lambda repressor-like predicted transcriptional regulator
MPPIVSAAADGVNSGYKGRAIFLSPSNSVCVDGQWRNRLRAALDDTGKSMRSVSLEAGCGPGYLHDILVVGKEPKLDSVLRIADALNIGLGQLLYGLDIGPQEEELLRLYAQLPERQRRAVLDLIASNYPKPVS